MLVCAGGSASNVVVAVMPFLTPVTVCTPGLSAKHLFPKQLPSGAIV